MVDRVETIYFGGLYDCDFGSREIEAARDGWVDLEPGRRVEESVEYCEIIAVKCHRVQMKGFFDGTQVASISRDPCVVNHARREKRIRRRIRIRIRIRNCIGKNGGDDERDDGDGKELHDPGIRHPQARCRGR